MSNDEIIPTERMLLQNYPNPFNPETMIEFEVKVLDHINISIFDLKGNLIESGEYKLGFRHGEWSTYEYNKKINTVFYNNGEKINEK